MPEEIGAELQEILEYLEDKTFVYKKNELYQKVLCLLENGISVSYLAMNRLLTVCVHDLHNDKLCIYRILLVITEILKKTKIEKFIEQLELLPSLLAILNILKTSVKLSKIETLQTQAYETISFYPNNVLIELATFHSTYIREVISLYSDNSNCNKNVEIEVQVKSFGFINSLLKALPIESRIAFVKEHLSLWFCTIIPSSFFYVQRGYSDPVFKTLETLTNVLVHIDYAEDPNWQHLLKCICDASSFPFIMKSMLEKKLENWDGLWKVCIRLLKQQITRSISSIGCLINSMLPVIETAFKMDVQTRCQAFKCWNVLIDNFAMETNEAYVAKRLKLLIIPLRSNNAKVEATTLAKFDTWWHLICKFQNRLDKLISSEVVLFLHFCFGKSKTEKNLPVPGLLTANTKKIGVEMFIEMAGHISCSGCGNVEKLNERLISTKLLVDCWNDWAYALKVVISLFNDNTGITLSQITCVWKSFVLIICELPDNGIRKDLFDELLTILEDSLQDSELKAKNGEVVMHLINSLFSEKKIGLLFTSRNQPEGPIYKILAMLMKPSFRNYYKSCSIKDIVLNLRPVFQYIVNDKKCNSYLAQLEKWMLSNNTPQDQVSFLWTALIETLFDCDCADFANLDYILLWPLKSYNSFTNVQYSTFAWFKLLDKVYTEIVNKILNNLIDFLWSQETEKSNILLKLYALVSILNHITAQSDDYEKYVELLTEITKRTEDYITFFEDLCTPLTTTLVAIMKNGHTFKTIEAKSCIKCIKNILICVIVVFENNVEKENYVKDLENILTHMETYLQIKSVSPFTSIVVDILLKLPSLLNKYPSMKNCILSVLKTCASNMKEDPLMYKDIKKAINKLVLNIEGTNISDRKNTNNAFTTPDVKAITRKSKKKEATIINTVVDNGEEFIVVKSNWKFNPKKLTENQKEKLQRKREDIPALYQDLSQSQDEFKLTSWKTDSQDASSTNSKSTNASKSTSTIGDVSNILKNIPSSDVVPKIIENIMSENAKKDLKDSNFEQNATVSPKSVNKVSATKDVKSPRMALKDRVFKNVRTLIEKSNVQKDSKDLSESLIQIENIPTTPISKIIDKSSLVNSAPPNMSTERPSRVKRKPKKFDDVEIFSLKRGRRSLSQSDSQPANEVSSENLQVDMTVERDMENEDKKLSNPIDINLNITDHDKKQNDKDTNKEAENTVTAVNNDINIQFTSGKQLPDFDPNKTSTTNMLKTNNISEKQDVANKKIIALIKDVDVTEAKNDAVVEKEDMYNATSNVKTPKSSKNQEVLRQNTSIKKSNVKKSRIEKELAIDTVEGHPLLKVNSERRVTRKNVTNTLNSSRRKSLTEKLNKSKTDNNSISKIVTPNVRKKDKRKLSNECNVVENQDESHTSESLDDSPLSEDVIESSQDSTFTTISTTSKNPLKKPLILKETVPLVIQKVNVFESNTQHLLNGCNNDTTIDLKSLDGNDDTDIPQNKTADINKSEFDTENMDTESIGTLIKDNSSELIVIHDDVNTPILINTVDTCIGIETQEIAEADTEPTDATQFDDIACAKLVQNDNIVHNADIEINKDTQITQNDIVVSNTADDVTLTISPSAIEVLKSEEVNTVSSPLKDDERRKKDFLDNTFEISPIKLMSPVREKKSPSPETSNDYVVIKLSSPVQSNGEPFEKCDSPEIFTEDKVSPDKRDLSPPRDENNFNINGSPSSSLSLKKNRPQVRSGGRAAQMLGLCVPDRLQSIVNSERSEPEESKKSSPLSTPVRRNLRILYNSVGDSSETSEEKDRQDSDNFLKFKRSLPTADSSPSCPILKRKLAEITDDATVSPASKRKRVSFHDPPVSTTISVQKYIEPCGIRSPQNTALKRLERQNLRSQQTTAFKSQKRLDNVFKLDNVLTKTVESFVDIDLTNNENIDNTNSMSLDETPAVEIVRNSDLNDTDPICSELRYCKDPIDNIASELSSPTMKHIFLKELESKITTIGDLAKMTELEVNRLCIKAPKVFIAKKVLNDYASKIVSKPKPEEVTVENVIDITVPGVCDTDKMDIETQTNDVLSKDTEVQTITIKMLPVCVQTDEMLTCNNSAQTKESGNKSTKDIITTCMAEKPDFVDELVHNLETSSKIQIAEKLPFKTLTETLFKNVTSTNTEMLLSKVLETCNSPDTKNRHKELSFLQDYLCDRFDSRDLILFCSQLLAKIHSRQ